MTDVMPALSRVLVVEDDYAVAMDVSRALEKQGYRVVGPVAGQSDALSLMASQDVDYAVLDIRLDGVMAFPVADALADACVPFIFATGCDTSVIPQRHRGVPLVQKPYRSDDLARIVPLRSLAPSARSRPVDLARSNMLLRRLPEADLARLQRHARRIGPGDGLLEEGTPRLLFPERGFCSLVLADARSGVAVGMVGPEGVVGAPSSSLGPPLPVKPVWHEKAEAIAIPMDAVRAILPTAPALQDALDGFNAALSIQLAWTAEANATLSVKQRVARWILMAQDRAGPVLHVTHDHLAILLGVRRAGVTSSLHILEGERWISAKRGVMTVLDRSELERFVGPSYGAAAAMARGPARASSASAQA